MGISVTELVLLKYPVLKTQQNVCESANVPFRFSSKQVKDIYVVTFIYLLKIIKI